MTDPDNFLSRWSRRKQEASEGKEKNETGETVAGSAPENQQGRPTPAPDGAPIPKFDVESLPPIEAINAETDIRAFMRADVPEKLKHAALRRAWSADPAIRDFMGPNENYWDAAGPDGIPGFGDLDPNLDVKRLVSGLFGETPRQDTPSESEADQAAGSPALTIQNPPEAADAPPAAPTSTESVPQRNENAAPQIEPAESAPRKKFARRHGGAMPR
jgi:hypothetical protein